MEIFQTMVVPEVLPFTVLAGLAMLYWLVASLGFLELDMDFGDFDLDLDLDGDSSGSGGLGAISGFLFGRDVPIMIPLTLFFLCAWVLAILGSLYLGTGESLTRSLLLLVPIVILSLVVARIVSMPFAHLFRKLMKHEEDKPMVVLGKICRVSSSVLVDGKTGQAEIEIGGAPLRLNVRKREGDDMVRGDEAIVVEQDEDLRIYFIKKLEI